MITRIVYTYPSPTINIGGSKRRRVAKIAMNIGLDSYEMEYDSVNVDGLNTRWDMADIKFLSEVIEKINTLNNKNLLEEVAT